MKRTCVLDAAIEMAQREANLQNCAMAVYRTSAVHKYSGDNTEYPIYGIMAYNSGDLLGASHVAICYPQPPKGN